MRHILIAAALSALVLAKPELYKEKEDFQYSRSSSDEGSKSGFYGAQRGNMGGNYEKAHNMDGLAQHQMSGLVRQIDGELGDGYKTRTGSVYTAANSRGIYGSGNYDLSNLRGRNFEETEAFGDELSHSSSLSHSAGYRSQSLANSAAYSNSRAHTAGYRRYQAGGHSQQFMQADNLQSVDQLQPADNLQSSDSLQSADNLQSADSLHSAHEYDYGNQAAHYSNVGFKSHHAYDQNANSRYSGLYGLNTRSQISSATPVRVVVRPGTRVTVPLTAQTYDARHATSTLDRGANTDAELLSTSEQQLNNGAVNAPKHYESSYSYRKEWEKHNTQPISVDAIPTVNPFPAQSEILGESQASQLENSQQKSVNSYNSRASNTAFAANTKSAASSHSRYQAGFNAQQSSGSALSSSGYNSGSHASNANGAAVGADSANLVALLNTKPKSYHSSYAYHKSWERQGDPYVIQPVGGALDGQTSQKLTAASLNHGAYASHQYGSQYKQAHQSYLQNGVDCDCDEDGHVRVARSYDPIQEQQFEAYQNFNQDQEELGQQTQAQWDNLQDLGQQNQEKFNKIEDFGQQSQSQWNNIQELGQQEQEKFDNLKDLGQEQQSQWNNMQDLGQQTQDQFDKLEDLGQQAQSKWENLDDLRKQAQPEYTQQQSQNTWDQIADLNQNTQSNLDQQTQAHGFEKPKVETFHNYYPQSQDFWNRENKQKELTPSFWANFPQNNDESYQSQNTDVNRHNPTYSTVENINKDIVNMLQILSSAQNKNYMNRDFITNSASQRIDTGYYDNFKNPLMPKWNLNDNSDVTNTFSNYYNNHNYYHNLQGHTETDQNSETETSLGGLWDKLDGIAEKTLTNVNDDDITHKTKDQESRNLTLGQNANESHVNNLPHNIELHNEILTSTESDLPSITGNRQPNDVGRGDIGPEDTNSISYTSDITHINQPYKTPQEIEALSLTQNFQETSTSIGVEIHNEETDSQYVLNQGEKNFIEELRRNLTMKPNDHIIKFISNTTPKPTSNDFPYTETSISKELTEKHTDIETSPEEKNMDHQFDGFGQLTQEYEKSDFENFAQQTQELERSQLEDFGQQKQDTSPNLGMENNREKPNSQNVLSPEEQQFVEQLRRNLIIEENDQILKMTSSTTDKYSDYFQRSRNNDFPYTQTSVNKELTQKHKDIETSPVEEQNMEHQFDDFGQQTQEFETSDLEDFSQQELEKGEVKDFGEQIQSSLPPEDNFEQANYHQNPNLRQYSNEQQQHRLENEQQNVHINNFLHEPDLLNLDEKENNQLSNLRDVYENSGKNQENQNDQLPTMKSEHSVVQNMNKETSSSPQIELETEKPGFWKKVGNKLSNAKNKIYSWFGTK